MFMSYGKMLMLEFVFKDTWKRLSMNTPKGNKFQWPDKKAFYHFNTTILKIQELPDWFNVFADKE